MAKKVYKFEQFNAEIIDPEVSIIQSTRDHRTNKVSVTVELKVENATYTPVLFGYPFSGQCTDEDLLDWVFGELETFEI